MTASSLITGYLSSGTLAAIPATPNVPANGLALYVTTDTNQIFTWTGSAWSLVGNVNTNNVLSAGSFSWRNQNSSTITNVANGGPLIFEATQSFGGDSLCAAYQAVPVGSWTITAKVKYLFGYGSNNVSCTPLGLDDGTKSKFFLIAPGANSYPTNLIVQHWPSFNSASGSGTDATIDVNIPNPAWFRIVYNSVTPSLTWSYSPDGYTWVTLHSESGSLYLTPVNLWLGGDLHNLNANAPIVMTYEVLTT